MITAQLCSVRVGKPQLLGEDPDRWVTGFHKTAVDGPLEVGLENLSGDEQADRTVHGGRDKAICVYPAEHFKTWSEELDEPSCGPGWFGENFTVTNQDESSVCIGDIYEAGSSVVQVSQPRGPCWKLGKRWGRPDFVSKVARSGRTGWYLRVLKPGVVTAGDEITLVERRHPQWTIQRVNQAAYFRRSFSRDELLRLLDCNELALDWRQRMLHVLEDSLTESAR